MGRSWMSMKGAVRRITAPVRKDLNDLVNILYDFLPLTSQSKEAVTFNSIFAESSVQRYLRGSRNKRQVLQKGFAELYRRHERLPWTIIRKCVPAAIEYRHYQRRPLRRSEVMALSDCLYRLGIDMRSELKSIDIDESLPRITVPPEELKQRLRNHDLVTWLTGEPLTLFENGHFNESVRKASEIFEDRVRELSGHSAYGRDLMAKVFSNEKMLNTQVFEPENRTNFVEGYKLLAMGSMAAIRNIFSHGDEERRSPEECFEILLFLNWLFRGLRTPVEENSRLNALS